MNIRSAGLSPKSDRKLQQSDVDWSDLIFVMDDEQRKRVRSLYRGNDIPKIIVLHIDDIYEYRDPELVELLLDRIDEGIESEFKL